jgi:hypothetical protein
LGGAVLVIQGVLRGHKDLEEILPVIAVTTIHHMPPLEIWQIWLKKDGSGWTAKGQLLQPWMLDSRAVLTICSPMPGYIPGIKDTSILIG